MTKNVKKIHKKYIIALIVFLITIMIGGGLFMLFANNKQDPLVAKGAGFSLPSNKIKEIEDTVKNNWEYISPVSNNNSSSPSKPLPLPSGRVPWSQGDAICQKWYYLNQNDKLSVQSSYFCGSGASIRIVLNGYALQPDFNVLLGWDSIFKNVSLQFYDSIPGYVGTAWTYNPNPWHYYQYNPNTKTYSTYSESRPKDCVDVTDMPTFKENTYIRYRGSVLGSIDNKVAKMKVKTEYSQSSFYLDNVAIIGVNSADGTELFWAQNCGNVYLYRATIIGCGGNSLKVVIGTRNADIELWGCSIYGNLSSISSLNKTPYSGYSQTAALADFGNRTLNTRSYILNSDLGMVYDINSKYEIETAMYLKGLDSPGMLFTSMMSMFVDDLHFATGTLEFIQGDMPYITLNMSGVTIFATNGCHVRVNAGSRLGGIKLYNANALIYGTVNSISTLGTTEKVFLAVGGTATIQKGDAVNYVDNKGTLYLNGTVNSYRDEYDIRRPAKLIIGSENSYDLVSGKTIEAEITNEGILNIYGEAVGKVTNNGTLNVYGKVSKVVANTGGIHVKNDGRAMIDFRCTLQGVVTNEGTLDVRGTVTTLKSNTGLLQLRGGASVVNFNENSGTAEIWGQVLNLYGNIGTLNIYQNGSLTVAENVTISGTIRNSGSFTVNGTVVTSVRNKNSVTIASNGNIDEINNFIDSATANINGKVNTLTNYGTANISGTVNALTNYEKATTNLLPGGNCLNIINEGTFNIEGTATGIQSNIGIINIRQNVNVTIPDNSTLAGTINNAGTLNIPSNSTLTGTINNAGTLNVLGKILSTLNNESKLTIDVNGLVETLNNKENGVATIYGKATTVNNAGTINIERILQTKETNNIGGQSITNVATVQNLSSTGQVTLNTGVFVNTLIVAGGVATIEKDASVYVLYANSGVITISTQAKITTIDRPEGGATITYKNEVVAPPVEDTKPPVNDNTATQPPVNVVVPPVSAANDNGKALAIGLGTSGTVVVLLAAAVVVILLTLKSRNDKEFRRTYLAKINQLCNQNNQIAEQNRALLLKNKSERAVAYTKSIQSNLNARIRDRINNLNKHR